MRFTKMEGLGNDYVYVNCFREKVYDPEILARLVSDRHRGIGGDGLILIGPSARADFNMDIYNADGSRAEMCGNGIRCLGKYVYDHGMTEKTEFTSSLSLRRTILSPGRWFRPAGSMPSSSGHSPASLPCGPRQDLPGGPP